VIPDQADDLVMAKQSNDISGEIIKNLTQEHIAITTLSLPMALIFQASDPCLLEP
jgi:hypothetical protein